MKMYKMKIMTEDQIAEIDKLIEAGHGDAINAFSKEIQNATMEGFTEGFINTLGNSCVKCWIKGAMGGVAIVVLAHAAYAIGEKVYHKIKSTKQEEKLETIVEEYDV